MQGIKWKGQDFLFKSYHSFPLTNSTIGRWKDGEMNRAQGIVLELVIDND